MKPVVEDAITAVVGSALFIVCWCAFMALLGVVARVTYEIFMFGWGVLG